MKKTFAIILTLALMLITACIAEENTMFVCAERGLIMRRESDLESSVAGCIPYGEQVMVTGRKGYFYECSYQGKTGYVWADYLTDEDFSALNARTMYVSAWVGLCMHTDNDLESSLLGAFDFGTEVQVTLQDRFFSRCTAVKDGKTYTGYMWTGYLSETVPDADEALKRHEKVVQYEDEWNYDEDWEW